MQSRGLEQESEVAVRIREHLLSPPCLCLLHLVVVVLHFPSTHLPDDSFRLLTVQIPGKSPASLPLDLMCDGTCVIRSLVP